MKMINIPSNGLKGLESIFQKQVRYFDKIIVKQILGVSLYKNGSDINNWAPSQF